MDAAREAEATVPQPGTKRDELTPEAMAAYRVPNPFVRELAELAKCSGRAPGEIRVLDWGCGRGRTVAALGAAGYDVYGVDVDPGPIARGRALLTDWGIDADRRTLVIGADGATPFCDGFFHAVLSDQVIEHVRDLEGVIGEMARLTAPGGIGVHIFPSHRRLVEPHLHMPFVHWLPKNGLRRRWIELCLRAGWDPAWPELAALDRTARAGRYGDYTIGKTFYRKPGELRRVFAATGFDVRFEGMGGPGILMRPMKRVPGLRNLARAWQCHLHATSIRARKRTPAVSSPPSG